MESEQNIHNDKDKSHEKRTNFLSVFIYTCIAILIVTLLYGIVVSQMTLGDSNERGTFGDMFGGINAVFSGFAFAGVIVTILMQMRELELTRNELKKSADAQEKSQKALNEQLKSMQKSSQLEAVKAYHDSFGMLGGDRKRIAKSILGKLTEEIFKDDRFEVITKSEYEQLGYFTCSRTSGGTGFRTLAPTDSVTVKFSIKSIGSDNQITILDKDEKSFGNRIKVMTKRNSGGTTTRAAYNSDDIVKKSEILDIEIRDIVYGELTKYPIRALITTDLTKDIYYQSITLDIENAVKKVQISNSIRIIKAK